MKSKPQYIGITGHRNYKDRSNIRGWMEGIAKKHGKDTTIITGGAIGADIIAAEEALRSGMRSIIILPMPYPIFTKRWNQEYKNRLNAVLSSSKVKIACPKHEYNVYAYLERNAQIVEDSDVVIAFWSGSTSGGTFRTIQKAINQDTTIYNGVTRQQIW